MKSKALSGQDSLLSIVQMPKGIPVATFAIGESGRRQRRAVRGGHARQRGRRRGAEPPGVPRRPDRPGRCDLAAAGACGRSSAGGVGVVGGGQLGRYFVLEARRLGYETWVLEPDASSPAGALADRHLVAPYDDPAALDEMGAACAAVTTEFENVPAAALDRLAEMTVVHPASGAVSVCQDRIAEKTFLRDNGIAHAPFAVIESEADLAAVAAVALPRDR